MTDDKTNPPDSRPAPPGFDAFNLTAATREALRDAGFVDPRPVQRAAFEPLRSGRDALIHAPAGAGRTLAFGIPLLDGLSPASRGTLFVVLAPTRERSAHVHDELGRLAAKAGLRLALCPGGAADPEVDALREGAHGVVGTPARTLEALERAPEAARSLRVLVLDSADELLALGFEREVEAVVQRFPGRYQGVFVSATLPAALLRLGERFLREPALVSLSESGAVAAEVRHVMFPIDPATRLRDLGRILAAEQPEVALVFCNGRDDAPVVANHLGARGDAVTLIPGDGSPREREQIAAAGRGGAAHRLVVADPAAADIDVPGLTHVVNYQFPASSETYVRRAALCRRSGRPGTVLSLVAPQDVAALYHLRLVHGIRPLERRLPSEEELAREREAEVVRGLLERFGGAPPDPAALSLLRRLATHARGDAVLSAVLREHLAGAAAGEPRPRVAGTPPGASASPGAAGGRPGPAERDDQAGAEAGGGRGRRRQREREEEHAGGTDVPPDRDRPPAEEEAGFPAAAEGPGEPPPTAAPAAAESPERFEAALARTSTGRELRNIYLNVGIHDGVDVEFLSQWVQARLAIGASEFGPVRVRDRSTLIAVPADRVDDAIGALTGLRFGGRVVSAEEARRR